MNNILINNICVCLILYCHLCFIYSLQCETKNISEESIRLNTCHSKENLNIEINELLQRHQTISLLSIIDTKLDEIPIAVCHLQNLVYLELKRTFITRITANCFTGNKNLISVRLDQNNITEIREKTFDGMSKLQTLSLHYNFIKEISPYVFSNLTDLLNLKEIDLSKNKLTSIDVWPILRASIVDGATFNFSDNLINNFKNSISWAFSCKTKRHSLFTLDLRRNNITHFIKFINTFFNNSVTLMCFFQKKPLSNVNIFFGGNPMNCDCVDFLVYRVLKYGQKIPITDQVYCSFPEVLYGRRYIEISPEEMICETKNCPNGCKCKTQPYNNTFHVICKNLNYLELPDSLPLTNISSASDAKYKLIFDNIPIKELSPRQYFENTEFLSLRYSKINVITNETWISFKNIKYLYLDNNNLTTMPKAVLKTTGALKSLSLNNNPFLCDCNNAWLKDWLLSKIHSIENIESIICSNPGWLRGKSIIHIENKDFCTDPLKDFVRKIYITVIAVFSAILVFCVIIYFCRVQVNALLKIHPFDRDECIGEDMMYDVFVSSSNVDRIIAIKLTCLLEDRGYIVCYHEKDFIGGQAITDNINTAIKRSRRLICLISEAYINSNFCMYEFNVAHYRNIEMNTNRLILLLLQPAKIISDKSSDSAFNQFLASHTYLMYSKIIENRYKNLLYVMPINPLKTPSSLTLDAQSDNYDSDKIVALHEGITNGVSVRPHESPEGIGLQFTG